jgi:hypothetical protein
MTFQMYLKNENKEMMEFLRNEKDARIKLVRGAYLKTEDKNLLLSRKQDTDHQYKQGIDLLTTLQNKVLYGTYNKHDLTHLNNQTFTQNIALLHGIPSSVVLDKKHVVYKYILYGSLWDTLPYIKRQLPSFIYNRFTS